MVIKSFRSASALFALASVIIAVQGVRAQSWIQLAPTGGPPEARQQPVGAYDPATNQMIIFGGGTSTGNRNDVWTLSLGASPQWTLQTPAGIPPAPRVSSKGDYDAVNSRLIVFGGGLGNSSPCANDVWVLANANSVTGTPAWSQLNPLGTAPAPRLGHTAVYDPNSNRLTIFGGNDCFSTLYGDVWVLSNANGLGGSVAWTQLAPSGTPPGPITNASAVYDPGSNRMIVFGGGNSSSSLNQVWVLSNANGLGGTPAWIQLAPSGTSIPPTGVHVAGYDVGSNRMTVFGGNSPSGPAAPYNDTWVLSNANGLGGTPAWTQLSPSGTLPLPRSGHAGVLDAAANRLIIFGGLNFSFSPFLFGDAWVLTNANGIGPLYNVCLLYDPSKAVKSGATIAIKLQLCDSNGNNSSSSSIIVHAVSVTLASASISGIVQDSGNANPDNDFRFDPSLGGTGGYIFNLSTKGMGTGTYNLSFTASGDAFVYAASFQVK